VLSAGAVQAGEIPWDGCWCGGEALHCYNMRRDVSGRLGETGANHTFTLCKDRYGNTSVWEDNWAGTGYSQSHLDDAWVEADMGCINLDSLFAAKSQTDQGFANACSGYDACAGDNPGYVCQNSYWPPAGCFCFPWQMGFRSRLQDSWMIECPVQGGGGAGNSSNPSDYDYGPYTPDNGPVNESGGSSLWRVCYDLCTSTTGSAVYYHGEYIGGTVACSSYTTECQLLWMD
jgi:hypothetical protein